MAKSQPHKIDWNKAFQPLLKKYKGKKHPLEYKNRYQLLVMVILSAQDSDKHINELAPALLKAFPSMKELAKAKANELYKFIGKVRNFANKTKWLMTLAKTVGSDDNIPATMEGLTALPGIGRKSANVIIRESGGDSRRNHCGLACPSCCAEAWRCNRNRPKKNREPAYGRGCPRKLE